jgi:lipopolysaccharide biosynthesis glycosyltransferase
VYTIALGIDRHYVLPAMVTLASFATATPCRDRADIAVRMTALDLEPAEVHILRDVTRSLGFGTFELRSRAALDEVTHGGYITPATYLRFTLDETFVNRPYLLCLDADVLVLDDLTSGFEHLQPGDGIGLVVDDFVQEVGLDEALPGLVDEFPNHAGTPYYNAGAMWMATSDLPRFRRGSLQKLREQRRFIYFNDQDALNLWLLDTHYVTALPGAYNRFELDRFRERSDWVNRVVGPQRRPPANTKVVHFVGSRKPWFRSCPTTEAVTTYKEYLKDIRRLLRRHGDLTTDAPTLGRSEPPWRPKRTDRRRRP